MKIRDEIFRSKKMKIEGQKSQKIVKKLMRVLWTFESNSVKNRKKTTCFFQSIFLKNFPKSQFLYWKFFRKFKKWVKFFGQFSPKITKKIFKFDSNVHRTRTNFEKTRKFFWSIFLKIFPKSQFLFWKF